MHRVGALHTLGRALHGLGRLPEAESAFREELNFYEQQPVAREYENQLRAFLVQLLRGQGKCAELENVYRDSLAHQRKLTTSAARQREVWLLVGLADFLGEEKRHAEAEAAFCEANEAGKQKRTR